MSDSNLQKNDSQTGTDVRYVVMDEAHSDSSDYGGIVGLYVDKSDADKACKRAYDQWMAECEGRWWTEHQFYVLDLYGEKRSRFAY